MGSLLSACDAEWPQGASVFKSSPTTEDAMIDEMELAEREILMVGTHPKPSLMKKRSLGGAIFLTEPNARMPIPQAEGSREKDIRRRLSG